MNKETLTRGLLSMAAASALHDKLYLRRMPDFDLPIPMMRDMPTASRNTVSQKKRRKMARRKG